MAGQKGDARREEAGMSWIWWLLFVVAVVVGAFLYGWLLGSDDGTVNKPRRMFK